MTEKNLVFSLEELSADKIKKMIFVAEDNLREIRAEEVELVAHIKALKSAYEVKVRGDCE